jgi:hypothetical protein
MLDERRSVAPDAPAPLGTCAAVYNVDVPLSPKEGASDAKHPRHHVYATETTGLLLIGVLLLILTLIRYWHFVNWSIH